MDPGIVQVALPLRSPLTIQAHFAQVALRILEAAKEVNAAQFVLVSPSGGVGGSGFLGGLFGGGGLNSSKIEQARPPTYLASYRFY